MYLKASVIFLFLTGSAVLLSFFPFSGKSSEILAPEQQSTAVVELFTSQGCSSCPSADRLLSEFIDQAEERDLPIFGLSFHVDYWNRLGWKDPYSSKAFTERQYVYARKMRSSSVYTPQMIVNGKQEFVGSDKRQASSAIRNALASQQAIEINVDNITRNDQKLHINYSVNEASQNQVINIALVERGISTQVTRGENRGRKLSHDNVVRVFEQKSSTKEGKAIIDIPEDMDLSKSKLIIYAQELDSFKILGATKASLVK